MQHALGSGRGPFDDHQAGALGAARNLLGELLEGGAQAVLEGSVRGSVGLVDKFDRACPRRVDVLKSSTVVSNHRILIIDDNAAIHHDFRKVLSADAELTAKHALDSLEADIFGEPATAAARPNFEIDSAHQGQEGVAMAHQAVIEGHPYAMAFVDMRMPPGWNGLETIEHLWAEDPDVQVVICSDR